MERNSQDQLARGPMLLLIMHRRHNSPQNRKTRPIQQHSSIYILKAEKTLIAKTSQNKLMITYARVKKAVGLRKKAVF
jgi:hypothetical protein